MRRRLTPISCFTTSLLILTLTLSLLYIPIATSQTSEEIISKLKELQEEVSSLPLDEAFQKLNPAEGRRKALANKIKAVIHKVEAGAYESAIKKLEKDLKNRIEAWITEDYAEDLIKKIDEIIKLIKGEVPPPPPPPPPELQRPKASFVFTPETPLAGEIVTFNASASHDPDGTIVSYTWDFGDDTVITVSDPVTTHIYAVYGIYTVSLTVTDNDDLTDTKSKPIKVIAPPTASFTYSPLAPLVNEVITFNASGSTPNGGEIESYTWDFGDGSTKTGDIVTHAYASEGTYSIVLNVTDTEGLWDTSTVDVTVYAVPLVDFPPEIIGVFRVPEEPNYDEPVRILASVIDLEGEVESVILSYSTNNVDWTNLTMVFNENIGFYTAEIPPQPYSTTVNYKVYASDDIGNWAVSSIYLYTVGDKYSPIVEIEKPTDGSYLRGLVDITVSVQEANLLEAKLTINGIVVSFWQEIGKHVFTWNTTSEAYPDGAYTIELSASDKAGNSAGETVTVTVDNTLPTAIIRAPSDEAFLRGTVTIEVAGEDVNLDKIELKINELVVQTWSTEGTHIYLWNTKALSDGTYRITLTVYDKAENNKETSVQTVVDNTSPLIEAPMWKPEEPSVNTQVNVTAWVSDLQPGSGLKNVTLWYRNTTMDDWQPLTMNLNITSWNWTVTIPAQSAETTIKFFIEAFDNAGNKAVSDQIYEYEVITPPGIPLAWIAALILLILAATAAAVYFWRKRRKERQGTSSERVKNYKLTILMCF